MTRADEWHRGYVQGTARDGGEVQGMTGVEGEYSLGQGILKSKVLLDYARSQAVYTSCHVCLLSISLSIHLSICLSILVYSFLLSSSHVRIFYKVNSSLNAFFCDCPLTIESL